MDKGDYYYWFLRATGSLDIAHIILSYPQSPSFSEPPREFSAAWSGAVAAVTGSSISEGRFVAAGGGWGLTILGFKGVGRELRILGVERVRVWALV